MEDQPFVSIVIPTLNSSKYILLCLKSIEMLIYPKDRLEVIVADNGSTDETVDIAKGWGACVVDATKLKVGGVRNRGASYAKGRIIAFADSDVLVGKMWIAAAVKSLKNDNIGAVGGVYRSPENGTWVEKAWTIRPVISGVNVDYLAGGSFILKRDIFEKLGGFSEDLIAAEDDDLSQRIRSIQLQLHHTPSCDVIHLGYPKTLIDVARRQVWLGSSLSLKSSEIHNPMTMLTCLFLLASISLFPAALIALKFNAYLIVNIFIIIIIPFIAAAGKSLKGSEYYSRRSQFAKLWIIYFYYFIGKNIGMLSTFSKIYNR